MDEAEAAPMFDGIFHHFVISVEFLRERGNQRLDMFEPHVCHNVHIQGGTHA